MNAFKHWEEGDSSNTLEAQLLNLKSTHKISLAPHSSAYLMQL